MADAGADPATIAELTGVEIVAESAITEWAERLDPAHFNPPDDPNRTDQIVADFAAFLDTVSPGQF